MVLTHTPASSDMAELAQLQPDLVLVDWPVNQHEVGWRTCSWIKYHPPTAHLPLIVGAAATPAVLEGEGVLRSQGDATLRLMRSALAGWIPADLVQSLPPERNKAPSPPATRSVTNAQPPVVGSWGCFLHTA